MTTQRKVCSLIHNALCPPRRRSFLQSTSARRLGHNWFPRYSLSSWKHRGNQYRGRYLPSGGGGAILPAGIDAVPATGTSDIVIEASAPEKLAGSIDECSYESQRVTDPMPMADTFDIEIDEHAPERLAYIIDEADMKEEANEYRIIENIDECSYEVQGLLDFMEWWYRLRVDISVKGKLLRGIPAFIKKDTLRVFGEDQTYIIPMKNIDFIGTDDGLRAMRSHFGD